ncbi:MAG TPA: FAD-dependent oxidoreductase [Candidatus Limnocylindrales bacterium]|nr:FAD-dependent oxidoreductase [Candidatus Limnocylindrales bacterium]
METQVCVVGGGPAGLMLGLLLARQGIEVMVLEKHADFLRDFRGDTVHSSTLTLLDELGLGERMAGLGGQRAKQLRMTFDDGTFTVADFTRLPGAHPYLLFVPQWDFLDMLASEAQKYPSFKLFRSTETIGVLRDAETGAVTGVRARRRVEGDFDINAQLTVACDGRFSTVRESLGLRPKEFGAPMDVLWFRVSRGVDDLEGVDFRFGAGGLMIVINRGDYYQCAFVIAKGGYDALVAQGLDRLRERIGALTPYLADRLKELSTWDDIKLLTVRVDQLERWHGDGYLLIGDAAHAMSPIGGVGINLAIQDAVATARLLGSALKTGRRLTDDDLAAIRRRRRLPTELTQRGQRLIQSRFLDPLLHSQGRANSIAPLRLVSKYRLLQGIPARVVGLGVRPEHLT